MGTATTFWAPLHRALGRWSNLGNQGQPPMAAPSLDYLASGVQDHRMAANARGNSLNQPGIVGWYGGAQPMVANIQPAAAGPALIAPLANAVSGTPMTLVAATGGGVTVVTAAAPAFFMPSGLKLNAGVVIGSLPALEVFGGNSPSAFKTGFYRRSSYVGRAVSITGVASGSGGAFKVFGYDIYGYPMNETITVGAGVNTVNGKKAWKAILTVIPQFSNAFNYSVGVADIFGFGIRADYFGNCEITWADTCITANTGFVAADTNVATATTGDVRGTYAVQTASDGTKRLTILIMPDLGDIISNPTTGLFGNPQF